MDRADPPATHSTCLHRTPDSRARRTRCQRGRKRSDRTPAAASFPSRKSKLQLGAAAQLRPRNSGNASSSIAQRLEHLSSFFFEHVQRYGGLTLGSALSRYIADETSRLLALSSTETDGPEVLTALARLSYVQAAVAADSGRPGLAQSYYQHTLRLARRSGSGPDYAITLRALASLSDNLGESALSWRLTGHAIDVAGPNAAPALQSFLYSGHALALALDRRPPGSAPRPGNRATNTPGKSSGIRPLRHLHASVTPVSARPRSQSPGSRTRLPASPDGIPTHKTSRPSQSPGHHTQRDRTRPATQRTVGPSPATRPESLHQRPHSLFRSRTHQRGRTKPVHSSLSPPHRPDPLSEPRELTAVAPFAKPARLR
ncbi:hypothetical protein SMICM304S_07446 [Streptomyces microflavus]